MIKIFSSAQSAIIDNYTICHEPIKSIDLMERASNVIAIHIGNLAPTHKRLFFFIGPGNNGGDGLAIARLLSSKYSTTVCLLSPKISTDARANLELLKKITNANIIKIDKAEDLPALSPNDTVIDALFGSGLNRALTGIYKQAIEHINNAHCNVIAIDAPSGLLSEENADNDSTAILKATHTIAIEYPSLSFLLSENNRFVENLIIANIGLHPTAISSTPSQKFLIEMSDVKKIIKPLATFAHKGNFGHALIVAGGKGKMGAAILSSKAALRTGAGLVTCHVPECGVSILQSAVPEVMASIDSNETFFSSIHAISNYNAIGIGPGIGTNPSSFNGLMNLIASASVPLLLDADALNLMSLHEHSLDKLPPNTILTPHPKEFDRIAGKSENSYQRHIKQIDFAVKHQVYIVLKGAYTAISTPHGDCYFNPTGNPGMATAGSGDVLTGIITSLLAQHYSPLESCLVGVYLHGLAGDIATEKISSHALIASDILDNISNAYIKIETHA